MSLTITHDGDGAGKSPVRSFDGALTIKTGQIDFDDSYPTGGESFDLSAYFHKQLLGVLIESQSGYKFEYDDDNKKIKVYEAEGTPTGTVSQPTFAGNVLSPVVEEEDISSITINRIYHGEVTGGPFEAGEVITGGTSAATAVVSAVNSDNLEIEDIGLDSVYNLIDELLTDYIAHCALVGDPVCHDAADTDNNDPTALADKSWASIYASLNSLKAKYNAHDVENGTYHDAAGTAHQISSADADTAAKAVTLANEIKTDYTAHIADDTAHTTADTTNTVSADDSCVTLQYDETLTGETSGASATSSTTVIDIWEPDNTISLVQTILENSDSLLDVLSPSVTLATGDARVQLADNEIETLLSDGYTALKVTYIKGALSSGEVNSEEDLSTLTGVRFFAWGV